MGPSCSVVIPAYRPTEHLESAVASIDPAAAEIVVVDDGSPEPCEWVRGLDDRVRYVRQANAGVAAARNRGVRESTGDAVSFLDQDDVFVLDKVHRSLTALRDEDADFCYTAFSLIDERGQGTAPGWGRQVDYPAMLRGETGVQLSTLTVRRSWFARHGLFDTRYRFAGDQQLALRLLRTGRGCFLPDALVGYRLHGANESRRFRQVEAEMRSIWREELAFCDSPELRRAQAHGLRTLGPLFSWQAHDSAKAAAGRGDYVAMLRDLAWAASRDPRGAAARLLRLARSRVLPRESPSP